MTATIKLDFISDIVCPWCIIGYKRLEKAISELGIQDRIDLEWQPFELNPGMPTEGENVQEHIIRKYGSTPQESKRSEENIAELGAELDFRFDFFDAMKIVNTRDAHILLDYAKDYGKQTELKMRLFNAFFNQRKDISDRQILIQELQQAGLNSDEALLRLENDEAREGVKTTETFWHSLGVSSVPTMVFNRSSALTGAQPVEVYKQVLTELLTTENTKA
jgi:predicted DsbA family dithiol-disulfide isomerase